LIKIHPVVLNIKGVERGTYYPL